MMVQELHCQKQGFFRLTEKDEKNKYCEKNDGI